MMRSFLFDRLSSFVAALAIDVVAAGAAPAARLSAVADMRASAEARKRCKLARVTVH